MSDSFYAKCKGFEENVVLTVKNSFIDSDIRQILIEKDVDHGVKYHNRSCAGLQLTGEAVRENYVSSECSAWFNSLSEDQETPRDHHTDITSEDFNGNRPSNRKVDCTPRPPEDNEKDTAEDEKPKDKYSCVICGLNFDSRRSLQIHTGRQHKDAKSQESVRSKYKQQKPRTTARPPKTQSLVRTEAARCNICGKIYDTELNLKKHVRRSHETKQKPCHICGMMVKELSIHIKYQHLQKDLKKYCCEFCGKGFKGYSGYQFHVAGHTGEKKYSCGGCAKTFRTSSEAKKCERGHQGIYKWNCSLCSYKCHQKNKFVRHMRTHTKSEPYSCPLCVHRAARKDYLQKHILKTHTGVSLEQLESFHPDMYNIQEKISFQEGKESRSTEEIKEKVRESRLSVLKNVEVTESYQQCGDTLGGPGIAQQVPESNFSVEEEDSSELISAGVRPDDLILRREVEVEYFKI